MAEEAVAAAGATETTTETTDPAAGTTETTETPPAAETAETEETGTQGQETADGEAPAEGADAEEGGESESLELTDDSVLKIGDAEHTFAEISEALGLVSEARGRLEEANSAIERSNGVLEAISSKPADALVGIFTSIHGGDQQKGYEATVKLAAQIINRHNELQQMPPGERRALTLEQELAEARSRLKSFEDDQSAKQELELSNRWATAITEGLKTGGLPESYLGRVAVKIADAQAAKRQLSIPDAIGAVKADLKRERADLVKTLEPDEIPDGVAQKLAQKRIDAAKKLRSVPGGAGKPGAPEPEKKDGPIIYDPTDFLKTLANIK